MLSLTKRTEYALMALFHLARRPGALVSAREISERHNVPLPLLMNVLKQLQQNELLESVRGSRGGYRLLRRPNEMSLADVIAATERPVKLVACADGSEQAGAADGEARGGRCEMECHCPIREPLRGVHERFERFLRQISLADLAFGDGGGGCGREHGDAPLRILG